MFVTRRTATVLDFFVGGHGQLGPRNEALEPPPFFCRPQDHLRSHFVPSPEKGTEVVVLYEEGRFTLDNNGKSTQSIYRVYKIVSQNGVEGWDNLSVQWEPWHEEKPTLQARVITRDLVSHALDQKSITDSPASDGDSDVYGDMRVVRAPLPAVAPGAVVEEEETWKESAPLYAAGTVSRYGFGLRVPVQETRLVLDYPASIRLQYKKQLLPDVKEERSEKEGRVHLEFLQGPMDALESGELYLPSDQPVYPQVFFSTGESWQKIASSYAAIVDEQIAKGNQSRAVEQIECLGAAHAGLRLRGIGQDKRSARSVDSGDGPAASGRT